LQEVITLGRTLKKRATDILAYFDRPGTSNGPTEAINGRLEHLPKGSNRVVHGEPLWIAPQLDFTVADVQSRRCNPTGRYKASDFRFPYPDGSFDVVLVASVFTRMLASDVKHYMHEVVRVLKPGGRSLITFFLLNEESSALSKEGKGSVKFEHEMPGARTAHAENPQAAIRYPEAFIRDLYGECGLELREPLRYGTWCGRTNGMSWQDVVIAVQGREQESSSPSSAYD
jgi:SAM-dependent methyltransferase